MASRQRSDPLLTVAIPVAAGMLVVSWFLPFMSVETLIFFEREVSIVGGLVKLWEVGEHFLAIVILVFSMVFPLAKIAGAWIVWFHLDWSSPRASRAASLLHTLGRWSMLDVFVVALMVVMLSFSIVSDVVTHFGIYVFAASVLASMLIVQRIEHLLRRSGARA